MSLGGGAAALHVTWISAARGQKCRPGVSTESAADFVNVVSKRLVGIRLATGRGIPPGGAVPVTGGR